MSERIRNAAAALFCFSVVSGWALFIGVMVGFALAQAYGLLTRAAL